MPLEVSLNIVMPDLTGTTRLLQSRGIEEKVFMEGDSDPISSSITSATDSFHNQKMKKKILMATELSSSCDLKKL